MTGEIVHPAKMNRWLLAGEGDTDICAELS